MKLKRRMFLPVGFFTTAVIATRKTVARDGRAQLALVAAGKAFPFRYFSEAMKQFEWIEGQNLSLTIHILGADTRQRQRVAVAAVAMRPDMIVAAGVSDALAVHSLNGSVPIVVITGTDLEHSGLVQSLRHPGGSVTGLSTIGMDLDGKRLEMLRELMPTLRQAALLGNPTYPNDESRFADATASARSLSIVLHRRSARSADELDTVFAAASEAGDQAMVVPYNALTYENLPQVIALANSLRLPTAFEVREYVEGGGLFSFGPVYRDYFKGAAALADRILKGDRPGDLPIEQPTKFELVINRKTANALGLALPPALLARVDEIIE